MGRRIELVRSNQQQLVRPIRFGGTDAATVAGLKNNLDIIDQSLVGANNGISKMGQDSIVPYLELPYWAQAYKDYVWGPKRVKLGYPAFFVITNYSENVVYDLVSNGEGSTIEIIKSDDYYHYGSGKLTEAVIAKYTLQLGQWDPVVAADYSSFVVPTGTVIVTPPNSVGLHSFTINGRLVQFEVYNETFYPDVLYPFIDGAYRSNQNFQLTDYVPTDGNSYCVGTEVQFSRTDDFAVSDLSLVYNELKTLFSLSAGLVEGQDYYVRCRFKEQTDTGLSYQAWSRGIHFTYLGAA